MANFTINDADDVVALKAAIMGPAGTGKTYGALRLAHGMAAELEKTNGRKYKVGIIDTENKSGKLYRPDFPFYDHFNLRPPFTVDNYIECIRTAEEMGVDILIIDSTSHAWKQVTAEKEAVDAKGGNQWTNWGPFKKKYQRLTDEILQSPMHIIATMRAKTDYVQSKNAAGKVTVEKKGMGAIQEPEIEYEFTLVLEVRHPDTYASARKDRTKLWKDGRESLITERDGAALVKWLSGGVSKEPEVTPVGEKDNLRMASYKKLISAEGFPIKSDDKPGLCKYVANLIGKTELFTKLSEMSQHNLDTAYVEFMERMDGITVVKGALETEGLSNDDETVTSVVEDLTNKDFSSSSDLYYVNSSEWETVLEKLADHLVELKKNVNRK